MLLKSTILFTMLAAMADADHFELNFTATSTVIQSSGTPFVHLNLTGSYFETDGICDICTIQKADFGNIPVQTSGMLEIQIGSLAKPCSAFCLGEDLDLDPHSISLTLTRGGAEYNRSLNPFTFGAITLAFDNINGGADPFSAGHYHAVNGTILEVGTLSVQQVRRSRHRPCFFFRYY